MELNEPTTADVSTTGNGASASEFTPTGTTPSGIRQKFDTARGKVVDGATAATDWIKQQDLDSLKTGIEAQVRNHPTRSLLVALGVGYLLGRALRRDGSA